MYLIGTEAIFPRRYMPSTYKRIDSLMHILGLIIGDCIIPKSMRQLYSLLLIIT